MIERNVIIYHKIKKRNGDYTKEKITQWADDSRRPPIYQNRHHSITNHAFTIKDITFAEIVVNFHSLSTTEKLLKYM